MEERIPPPKGGGLRKRAERFAPEVNGGQHDDLLPDFEDLAAARNVHVVHIFELLVHGAVLRRVGHHLLEVLFISGEAVVGARDDDAVPLPGHVCHHVRLFLCARPLLEKLGKLRGISRFADEYVVDDDHKDVDSTRLGASAQVFVLFLGSYCVARTKSASGLFASTKSATVDPRFSTPGWKG